VGHLKASPFVYGREPYISKSGDLTCEKKLLEKVTDMAGGVIEDVAGLDFRHAPIGIMTSCIEQSRQ
jgi:hypothetical protein